MEIHVKIAKLELQKLVNIKKGEEILVKFKPIAKSDKMNYSKIEFSGKCSRVNKN